MKRFAGLSLVPASQFIVRVSLLFAFPSSAFSVLYCSYHDYALHCSHDMSRAWRCRMVAWACATYQYHANGTDMVGQSVSQSVDAHGPVDHASVGFA